MMTANRSRDDSRVLDPEDDGYEVDGRDCHLRGAPNWAPTRSNVTVEYQTDDMPGDFDGDAGLAEEGSEPSLAEDQFRRRRL